MSINGKNFSHLPLSNLMAIVKRDLRKLDDEGLIDEGSVVKEVMACNDRFGLHIREVKQCVIPVENGEARLPINFEKLYYACALQTAKGFEVELKDPFDNSFDRDPIYEAKVDRTSLGCAPHYQVVIQKITKVEVKEYHSWTELKVVPTDMNMCHHNCPNLKRGTKTARLRDDGVIELPFETGELYVMFLASMMDEEGQLLFPFHPRITPYYEWVVKEKIITDAIFNSDGRLDELRGLKQDAQRERSLAWMEAFSVTTERSYMDEIKKRKEQELRWFKQYFAHFN